MSDINTINEFLVGSNGQTLQPMMIPVMSTRQQAYRFAAWVKELAIVLPEEEDAYTFEEYVQAIREID